MPRPLHWSRRAAAHPRRPKPDGSSNIRHSAGCSKPVATAETFAARDTIWHWDAKQQASVPITYDQTGGALSRAVHTAYLAHVLDSSDPARAPAVSDGAAASGQVEPWV